ncbi:MAG: hypothetical protein ACTSSJ_02340 [Candidatus Odinarchaeia archaeon]
MTAKISVNAEVGKIEQIELININVKETDLKRLGKYIENSIAAPVIILCNGAKTIIKTC